MTDSYAIPRHPLGVRPSGNITYGKITQNTSRNFFESLPESLFLHILELLDYKSLLKLGQTSLSLYAFSRLDDLWRVFCIECPPDPVVWCGSWYTTFSGLERMTKLDCQHVCSDILYRPFLCAHTPLDPYTIDIPLKNQVTRLSDLDAREFEEKWTETPFILTESIKEWPAYKDLSAEKLLGEYGEVDFRAEAVDWPLKTYVQYMNNTSDESPLYLFDKAFVEKMNLQVGREGTYWVPDCFAEDLFDALEEERPDNRWLIMGPERSGSTFHKDPNATSAWNAVLRGSKYWIMFPGGPHNPPPPGVYVSDDESEVTSPLSIAEWLLAFHAQARRTKGCIEGICHEGEILHVPSGWWHLVVNLSPSIAITQNFVPRTRLAETLLFLRDKPDQVSGFRQDTRQPFELFSQKMQARHPDLLAKAIQMLEHEPTPRKRKWDEIVHGSYNEESVRNGNGFGFGFGSEDGDDDIP